MDTELLARITTRDKDILTTAASGKRNCIEFGCGGSTLLLANAISGKIVSIESDKEWIAKLNENAAIQAHVAAGKLRFIHADIGTTGQWGSPLSNSDPRKWRNYYTRHWQVHGSEVDFVFIDGRFRVMCAVSALFFLSDTSSVCIHDFVHRRSYYSVLKFFDVVDRGDEIVSLKKRQDIDLKSVYFDLMDYQFDPS